MLLSAVLLSPKPMILPPDVVFVLTHASAENAVGPGFTTVVAAGTVAEPGNVVAALDSVSAPGVPRWAEESTVRSLPPAQS